MSNHKKQNRKGRENALTINDDQILQSSPILGAIIQLYIIYIVEFQYSYQKIASCAPAPFFSFFTRQGQFTILSHLRHTRWTYGCQSVFMKRHPKSAKKRQKESIVVNDWKS